MMFKASDLPYHSRQEILGQLRRQISAAEYSSLVKRFGEDGLLELAFEKARELSEAAPKVKEGFWSRHGWWIVIGVVFIVSTLAGYGDLFTFVAIALYVGAWALLGVLRIWNWLDEIVNPPWLKR